MKKIFLALILMGFLACTSKPDVRIPPDDVMHFPYSMALRGKTLVVNATSADGKYDFGRLVTLNTDRIKQAIDGIETKAPIAWSQVVTSNVLIPREVGEISFSDSFVAFASRANSQLIALPVADDKSNCNDPMLDASLCPNAQALTLSEQDPYAVKGVHSDTHGESILVSYLSSDAIDLVRIDKTDSKNGMKVVKSFKLSDWLINKKNIAKSLKNQRLITRKIQVTFAGDLSQSKAYFLTEQHPKKNNAPTRTKASYLVAVKVSDLMDAETITDAMVDVFELSKLFFIGGVQDFHIEADGLAYILAREPEALYKIKLQDSTLVETNVVCTGATSMAVNKNKDMIIVPCFKDNRRAMYSLSFLERKNTSKVIGRGPSYVVIDEINNLIYCSFNTGGFVAILDDKLNELGHVFNKAPHNRVGS